MPALEFGLPLKWLRPVCTDPLANVLEIPPNPGIFCRAVSAEIVARFVRWREGLAPRRVVEMEIQPFGLCDAVDLGAIGLLHVFGKNALRQKLVGPAAKCLDVDHGFIDARGAKSPVQFDGR